ncbi:hypothetical protein Pla163_12500 [Planctomycetes bacterium Pla163]|uniref:DUF2959 domain-containing protein n=1 Tax=Rohdeia mirabilis TaxID=2528008 RepID=A0A518CY48_9BACT|nr:hypothetical protein Pla163_12500 [Planctomycetes bacterium Pla163]
MLTRTALLVALALPLTSSCQGAYYSGLEAFGIHKRDVFVDRVEDARDAQADAKEAFVSTLAAFRAVSDFDGGSVEDLYQDLDERYRDCASRAAAVDSRIDGVTSVSKALFEEWETEISEISDAGLRSMSQQRLDQARGRYSSLVTAMRAAESRMQPVLTAFKDRVLFLKHDLNAQAIASLAGTLGEIEIDVDQLIGEMESAIAEADALIATIGN